MEIVETVLFIMFFVPLFLFSLLFFIGGIYQTHVMGIFTGGLGMFMSVGITVSVFFPELLKEVQ